MKWAFNETKVFLTKLLGVVSFCVFALLEIKKNRILFYLIIFGNEVVPLPSLLTRLDFKVFQLCDHACSCFYQHFWLLTAC